MAVDTDVDGYCSEIWNRVVSIEGMDSWSSDLKCFSYWWSGLERFYKPLLRFWICTDYFETSRELASEITLHLDVALNDCLKATKAVGKFDSALFGNDSRDCYLNRWSWGTLILCLNIIYLLMECYRERGPPWVKVFMQCINTECPSDSFPAHAVH